MPPNVPTVEPLTGMIGAEILGIDLSLPLGQNDRAMIENTLFDRGVVFFRDQILSPDQHVAFAKSFAPININRFFDPVDGWPMIAEVRKEPSQKKNIGGIWHTDQSYDERPALGSILYAKELPPCGGDTLFASMYAAYEALSDGLKDTLRRLRAIHSSRHVFGKQVAETESAPRFNNSEAAVQDAVHPVVIRHPGSGRQALYVNPEFTIRFEGWTEEESRPLLHYLFVHGMRPEFQCRFRWRERSVAFWDNRATWHFAVNDYSGERRLMHRITLEGEQLS